jgi:hypothetical protein
VSCDEKPVVYGGPELAEFKLAMYYRFSGLCILCSAYYAGKAWHLKIPFSTPRTVWEAYGTGYALCDEIPCIVYENLNFLHNQNSEN